MTSTVGVMGCGWLGLPLAKRFAALGYRVKGTTTSDSKLKHLEFQGIKGFTIKLGEKGVDGNIADFLFGLDTLIINVPPGLRGNSKANYVLKMELLLEAIKKASLTNILFVSSTSVYGNVEGEVTEETLPQPETESGKQLLKSEKLFLENKNLNTTVIRFGGLIGLDRHPVNHLAGKKSLKNGEASVNLIHLDDCIQMITTVVKNNYWNTIFNGVYPLHPTKEDYYTSEALKRGLTPPEFEASSTISTNKQIICRNYLNKLNRLYTTIIS